MAKNFSNVDKPLPSLAREDDRHVNVDRDSDRPLWQADRQFWQADRPGYVVSLSPEQINPQVEQPVAVAETAVETNGDGWPRPIVTVAINDEERWTNEGLKQAQGADPEIRPVVEWLLEGARPEWNNILHASTVPRIIGSSGTRYCLKMVLHIVDLSGRMAYSSTSSC